MEPFPFPPFEFWSKIRYREEEEEGESDDDVEVIGVKDDQNWIWKKNKRAKVVPHDIIEIEEDEEVANVSNGKAILQGYDKNWANCIKEALAQDLTVPASTEKVGSGYGFPANPLKISALASNPSDEFLYSGFHNLPYYANSMPCNNGDQIGIYENPAWGVEALNPWFKQPAIFYNNQFEASSSSFSNQLNSGLHMGKDDTEFWMSKPAEIMKTPAANKPIEIMKSSVATERETTPCQLSFRREKEEEDEVIKKFRLFKRFDTVSDHSDHHYTTFTTMSTTKQASRYWAKTIQQEWKILEKDLPDTIFVRVYEERMDLLRAVILGAAGTPYHDGLFFFDFFFPPDYPNVPPQVYYHSGGLRLNPNLYNCGKVCLSLLNTWHGNKNEKWTPRKSTVLQVLLSIQALVLNAQPFFNEPGYERMAGGKEGEKRSQDYNENVYILSCRTMLYALRRPPKHFEEFVAGHFREHAHVILVACKAYMEGAQVGCLVGGGVQDVDEGDKSGSQNFKMQVAEMVKSLVPAFTQNGAKDCEQFLPPTKNYRYAPDHMFRPYNPNVFPFSANKPIMAATGFSLY